MRILLFFCLGFCSIPAYTWNAAGHELVAQIAYERLTPLAKKRINYLLSVKFHAHRRDALFLRAATWPDRYRRVTAHYTPWHYVNTPLIAGPYSSIKVSKKNVIWAISHAEHIVSNPRISLRRRAKYLSFLIHFLGDIHQPLHCVTRYTKATPPPYGDRGGNLFPIQSPIANNLHAYWDRGLGQLYRVRRGQYLRAQDIIRLANKWTAEFPARFFKFELKDNSPKQWALESFKLDNMFVYQLLPYARPSREYIKKGRQIVRERVVLAGYRLAYILNHMFS